MADATGTFGAGGALGAVDALKRLMMERIAAQQYADKLKQQGFDNALRTRQLDQGDQIRRDQLDYQRQSHADTLAEQERQHKATEADRTFKENQSINESVPPDTFLEPSSPIVGRLQSIGALTPQEERPAVDTGPLLPGDTGAAKKQGFLKRATAKQIDTQTDNTRQADQIARERERDTETGRHNRAMENKPVSEQGWTVQQGMVNGQPGWVRINSRTGQILPVDNKDITPKPPAALEVKEHDKKSAIDTLGQLDQAIENAKDLVGPGEGRFTSLEQMAGSANPRAQVLGTKMLLAKMKVDAALGGLRAAASPQLLARWDNLLANKVTPEGLRAAVQAIREVVGGSDAPVGGSKIKSITEIK